MIRNALHTRLTFNAFYPTPLFPVPATPPPPAWPGNLPTETDSEPFLNGNCRMCCSGGDSSGMGHFFSHKSPICSQTTHPVRGDEHTTERSHSTRKHTPPDSRAPHALWTRAWCRQRLRHEDSPVRPTPPHSPSGFPWSAACSSRPWSQSHPHSQPAAPWLTRPGHNFRPLSPEKGRLERLPRPSPSATHPALPPPHFRSRLPPRPSPSAAGNVTTRAPPL